MHVLLSLNFCFFLKGLASIKGPMRRFGKSSWAGASRMPCHPRPQAFCCGGGWLRCLFNVSKWTLATRFCQNTSTCCRVLAPLNTSPPAPTLSNPSLVPFLQLLFLYTSAIWLFALLVLLLASWSPLCPPPPPSLPHVQSVLLVFSLDSSRRPWIFSPSYLQ